MEHCGILSESVKRSAKKFKDYIDLKLFYSHQILNTIKNYWNLFHNGINWSPSVPSNSTPLPGIFQHLKCFKQFPFFIINILVMFLSYLSETKRKKFDPQACNNYNTHTKLTAGRHDCKQRISFPPASYL